MQALATPLPKETTGRETQAKRKQSELNREMRALLMFHVAIHLNLLESSVGGAEHLRCWRRVVC